MLSLRPFIVSVFVFLSGSMVFASGETNPVVARMLSPKEVHLLHPERWIGPRQFAQTYSSQYAYLLKIQLQPPFRSEYPLQPRHRHHQWLHFELPSLPLSMRELIKRPMEMVVIDLKSGREYSTGINLGEIIDQNFTYSWDDLGVQFTSSGVQLNLWAPSAQSVRLQLFDQSLKPLGQSRPLREQGGVWRVSGPLSWKDLYYRYEVKVFNPSRRQLEVVKVTDPYSIALATNSTYSQIIDVSDQRHQPADWHQVPGPQIQSFSDIVLYELHVRDFSIWDESVPLKLRGKFKAFTQSHSVGMKHLKKLADAGVTHVHLLPLNDFGTVDESQDHAVFQPSHVPYAHSAEPQRQIGDIRQNDGFNWGYDPFHYFVAEGSYATAPDRRVLEFRQMVQALKSIGLHVVVDVVFNHTLEAGFSDSKSVFEKIVPGYFYRLNDWGEVENSSCCSDTASERKMMEKLILDALRFWVETYKVDGFRMDLANLHEASTVTKMRKAVTAAGGEKIYLYGEAWPFGSLMGRQGDAFTQWRSYGMGVGVFNDRLRDAVRGGSSGHEQKSDQGFATGLYYDFNAEPANRSTPWSLHEQRGLLNHLTDVVRIGMMGNLRDYVFHTTSGHQFRAGDYQFRGQGAAYAKEPYETINYVSAHDGHTLWDAIQAKMPFHGFRRTPEGASVEERKRSQLIALATVLLGQGIPSIHAGSEILRSKSGDIDSYDSGDWFNRLDYSLERNNWGVGLPPAWKNRADWSFWEPRLKEPSLRVSSQDIEDFFQQALALLEVRKSTAQLRLSTRDDVQQRVRFLNGERGYQQTPGLIVKWVDGDQRDLLVVINAANRALSFDHPLVQAHRFQKHEKWNESHDSRLTQFRFDRSTLHVPGRSIGVFWAEPTPVQ